MLLDTIFQSTQNGVDVNSFVVCLAGSALCGALLAMVHAYRNRTTANFLMTLVVLPALVQSVIMMVNGNVGTGVAVAGAFSLVRFRSMPGNSREITSVFAAMAVGLANGMGCVGLSLVLTVCFGLLSMALVTAFSAKAARAFLERDLRITIPENLDYSGVFDDIFSRYLDSAELVKVKTTNMGSLYELQYEITEKDGAREKEMIDELRVRNGNLNIVCGKRGTPEMAL